MVRYFPSDDRRRIVALVAATLVLIGLVVSPLANADDDLKDKQRDVKEQLSQAHNDLDESSAELRKTTVALRTAQSKLDAARNKLQTTRGELAASQARDEAAQAALVKAEADLATARADLKSGQAAVVRKGDEVSARVATAYEKGDPRLASISAMLSAQDPADVTRNLAATDAILDKENSILTELEAAKILLGVKEEQVEKQKKEVEAKREAAAANLKEMGRLEKQAIAQKESVATLVASRASAEASAQKVRNKDRAELVKLEAEQSRIERMLKARAIAAAKAAAKAEAKARAKKGKSSKRSTPKSSGGYLNFPVNGRVTSSFGHRVHPIYGYQSLHNGTDFGAGCGQPLYATADGKVIERYFQSAWGNRLIIDHGYQRGKGVATIYNHATRYTVSVGSRVKRGQLVGYVGSTGWSTGCHLHFIVMANGTPVDPMGWL